MIRIQVIHKKGDREDPGNYRPICGLPILYKLFATVLYARLAPSLHKVQPPDQADFRPNHRYEDHLTVYKILEQRSREWGVPLYISTIDFTKAFDSIKRSAIWSSQRYYGVKPTYVTLLQKLYKRQEGTVLTDKEREVFPIKKGTKQGDPLSSLLFNTVLQYSHESNLTKWQENKKGIRLSDKTEDCQTNLRFADDVLLFSTSLKKLRELLCDFKASTEEVGLGIHPNKKKILSNQDNARVAPSLHKIQPLDQAGFKPNHLCRDHLAQGSSFKRLILICVPHTSWHDLPYRGTMWQSCFVFFSFFSSFCEILDSNMVL